MKVKPLVSNSRDLSTLQAAYRNKYTPKEISEGRNEKLPPIGDNSRVSLLSDLAFTGTNPNYSEYVKKMEKMNRVTDYSSVVKVLNGETIRKRPQTFEGHSSKKAESKRDKGIAFAKSIPKPKSGLRLEKLPTPVKETPFLNSQLEAMDRRHQEEMEKVRRIKESINY